MKQKLDQSQLGKVTHYNVSYQPDLLCPIPRSLMREQIGIKREIPFLGLDIWNGYELSWLDPNGKPKIAIAEFLFPYSTENLIESKSFKLYLNSFNMTKFNNLNAVIDTLTQDLSQTAKGKVRVTIIEPNDFQKIIFQPFEGMCLDHLDVTIQDYLPYPGLLKTEEKAVEEKLYSHLLKSNCPVTGQPDWASVFIHYQGHKINREGLLKYIISFREHKEFHEQCVERMFIEIMEKCRPKKLSVYARYTRRGGLDINPFRSNFKSFPENFRLIRQ